jgi:heme exporter protein C
VTKASKLVSLGLTVSLAFLAFGFFKAMTAPTEATMGNLYRVIFWHVPNTIWSFAFPYVNCVASLLYLFWRQRAPQRALKADAFAIASCELTVLYTSVGLVTGMIWGRAAWGIWWTWDARLTTYLLLWLLYVSYLLLRRFSDSDSTRLLAAVLAIFAAVDIPICYMSIRWWRTQHPAPVFGGGPDSGMDPSMLPAFFINLAAFAVWGSFLLAVRYSLERRRQQAAERLVAQYLADPAIQPHTTLEAR